MDTLETRVPPVVWFAIAGFIIWAIAGTEVDTVLESSILRLVGVVLIAAGAAFGVAGVARFGQEGTTVNPHSIDRASALVTGGVYRATRNPMYLGLLLMLIGWGFIRGGLVALLIGSAGFVLVMNRLQIRPEERMLIEKFGREYIDYSARVRRWL